MAAQTLAEAAVLAFTRIDPKKIYSKTQVYSPDCVVVLDDSLLDTIDVGMQEVELTLRGKGRTGGVRDRAAC